MDTTWGIQQYNIITVCKTVVKIPFFLSRYRLLQGPLTGSWAVYVSGSGTLTAQHMSFHRNVNGASNLQQLDYFTWWFYQCYNIHHFLEFNLALHLKSKYIYLFSSNQITDKWLIAWVNFANIFVKIACDCYYVIYGSRNMVKQSPLAMPLYYVRHVLAALRWHAIWINHKSWCL